MRRLLPILLSVWLSGLAAQGLSAQSAPSDAETPWYRAITYHVLAEATYTYNFNEPASGLDQYRVFDYDDKTVELDQVQLVIQMPVSEPHDGGFRVDVAGGMTVPGLTAASGLFRNTETGESQDFDLMQAFVSYVVPVGSGLRVDAGKFFTYFCYEVLDSYAAYNDNASRSFIFGYSAPVTHTGIRASYAFSDKVSGLLVLTNGWDDAIDNNKAKSIGLQVTVTPTPKWSLYFNWMGGAEQKSNNHDKRYLYEAAGAYKATDRITLGFDGVYGTEQNAAGPGADASWSGLAGYCRFQITDRFALSLRGEYFDDPEGVRTGTIQNLKGVTITPEYKVGKHFVVRGDLRLDASNRDVFQKRASWVRRQPTASVQGIYVF